MVLLRRRVTLQFQRSHDLGSATSFAPAGALRFRNPAIACHAAGVLAGVLELARQILAGVHRCAAAGAAANGPRILRADRHGPAGSAGEVMARSFWPRSCLHLHWFGDRLDFLQLPFCRAAAHHFL